MAIRPHHVLPYESGPGAVKVNGTVLVTELSGSESVAHFDLGGQTWISQAHGVHAFEIGAKKDFHVEIDRCLYFGEQNQLIAA